MSVLVLEGGGMRGAYSAGVLEAFSEADSGRGFPFEDVVACSAGACVAASYLAGQPRRNRKVYLDFLDGDKLVRFRRLFTGGSVMDIDYLAFDVTLRLCPLDLDALRRSSTRLHIGVTDCETGASRYLTNHEDDLVTAIRATCSLPLFSRSEVPYQGRRYVDGGVSDPVPVGKAIELGAKDLVLVLTSSIESRGERSPLAVFDRFLSSSPAIRRSLAERHLRYRDAARLLASPPPGVRISVIRPSRPLPVTRTTTRRDLLEQACDLGYQDGRAVVARLETAAVPDPGAMARS
jgi:predicted patatin/cPLA2 family phospholipase